MFYRLDALLPTSSIRTFKLDSCQYHVQSRPRWFGSRRQLFVDFDASVDEPLYCSDTEARVNNLARVVAWQLSRNGNRPLLIVLMTSPAPMSLQHMLWCGIFITVVCYQLFHCDFWYRDGSSAQVTYTVTDCDANSRELPVEVTRGGLLTTNSFVGQACLLVSSVEDFGLNDFGVNQSALVHIKVYIFWLLNLM